MGMILVADADAGAAALLSQHLRRDGFDVGVCTDGSTVLCAARSGQARLVILDVVLPAVDGWEVCRKLRSDCDLPFIILTDRADEADRIAGLRLGADDYVTKPFSPTEVVERVKTVLRRTDTTLIGRQPLAHRGLMLSPDTHAFTMDGKPIALTLSEFRILETLMRAPGRVFTREQLLDVLGRDEGVFDRAVDVHIVNLRRKLDVHAGQRTVVETVRGIGYRLRA